MNEGKDYKHVPWNGQPELVLDLDEVAKDAYDGGGAQQHDEDPEIELQRRPIVGSNMGRYHLALIDDRGAAQH